MHAKRLLQVLTAHEWRRNPALAWMLHADQRSLSNGSKRQACLKAHGIVCRRRGLGNCLENAVAERLFQLLMRARIKRQDQLTRDACSSDVFGYIEMFHNPKCGQGFNGQLSPVEVERQAGQSGVQVPA